MNVDEIRELIQLVTNSGIAELEVQRGENRVRIRRVLAAESPSYTSAVTQPAPATPAMHPGPSAQSPATQPLSDAPKPAATEDPHLKLVRSPIVGTFYESASPGTPAFVRVGETVQTGRVLCIIESMKLMNEIEAEFPGVIESQLVPNGQAVEYGEALFAIRAI